MAGRTGAERAAWRESVVEDVLFADQRICDPHHHLWDHDDDVYLAPELAADLGAGHQVTQTVYVECGSSYRLEGPPRLAPVGETEFVLAQDAELERLVGHPVMTGIVGHVDLLLGAAAEEVLAVQVEAGRGRFKGVRHASAWDRSPHIRNHRTDPEPERLRDPRFIEGVRALGRLGLTYDGWMYHPQLAEAVELARAAPETTIIIDHLGGPLGIGPYADDPEAVQSTTRVQLEALAAEPNTRLKLGGIGMTIFGNRWHHLDRPPSSAHIAAGWADCIRWCIDTFGPDRAMFESNFPPDRSSCSYRTLWNAFKRIAEPYDQAERDLLFHDTAARTYDLPAS